MRLAVAAATAVGLLAFCAGAASGQQKAIAMFNVGGNGISGTIAFEERPMDCTVAIVGSISGLRPNFEHGLHIHAYGDVSQGCDSIGGHWNPLNVSHGDLNAEPSHAGDLGNVLTDGSGVALVSLTSRMLSRVGFSAMLGRALAVHNGTDDLGLGNASSSLLSGNSGTRLSCGVIGIAISGSTSTANQGTTTCGGTTRVDTTTAVSPQTSNASAPITSPGVSFSATSGTSEADLAGSPSSVSDSASAVGQSHVTSTQTYTPSASGGNSSPVPSTSWLSMTTTVAWLSASFPRNLAARSGVNNCIVYLPIVLTLTANWMIRAYSAHI